MATYDERQRNHFTWADQRHSGLDNSQLWPMWLNTACPGLITRTTAARGALGSSIDEREAQHDADGGAIVFVRPVNSVRDAQEIVFWTFYPPFGHRSQGSNQMRPSTASFAEHGRISQFVQPERRDDRADRDRRGRTGGDRDRRAGRHRRSNTYMLSELRVVLLLTLE